MKRVKTELFRDGDSWAVRLPDEWVGASAEVELVALQPGVMQIHLKTKQARFEQLLQEIMTNPLTPDDLPVFHRLGEPDRFDVAGYFACTPTPAARRRGWRRNA